MHKLFWGVVNAYSAFTFRKAMQQVLLHGGLGAVKWFKDLGPLDRWARWQFDPSLCNDENTNNFVESFNSTIGVDRGSPVLTMLEGTLLGLHLLFLIHVLVLLLLNLVCFCCCW